jgi:hypothetical protein
VRREGDGLFGSSEGGYGKSQKYSIDRDIERVQGFNKRERREIVSGTRTVCNHDNIITLRSHRLTRPQPTLHDKLHTHILPSTLFFTHSTSPLNSQNPPRHRIPTLLRLRLLEAPPSLNLPQQTPNIRGPCGLRRSGHRRRRRSVTTGRWRRRRRWTRRRPRIRHGRRRWRRSRGRARVRHGRRWRWSCRSVRARKGRGWRGAVDGRGGLAAAVVHGGERARRRHGAKED